LNSTNSTQESWTGACHPLTSAAAKQAPVVSGLVGRRPRTGAWQTVGLLAGCLLVAAGGTFAWFHFAGLTRASDQKDMDLDLPPIRQPLTFPATAGVPADMEVVGVSAGGKHRAYLLLALRPFQTHVVNDLLDSVPVTVSYCDGTSCIKVFRGKARGVPLDVSVGGWRQFDTGGRGGLVLKVHGKRYAHSSGKALDPSSAARFPYEEVPFTRTTWKAWKQAHPDTDVYVGEQPIPSLSNASSHQRGHNPTKPVVQ